MITDTMLPNIKQKVGDFNNPIFQKYLKSEMQQRYICPICDVPNPDYTQLYKHVNICHKDQLENPAVKEALDPLSCVKKILIDKTDGELITMGKFFGERITSEHNQHVLLNIIGKTGMGKSNAAMRIGEEVARYIATVKGGDPEDYFNITNIAIMRLDSIIPIIEDLDQKRFNIIVLDDIGASYSARDFNKAVNKNMNKVFQTFRDTNTMLIMTMPDSFLIDKVGRRLAHYQIEITDARHNEGISVGKLFEVIEQYRRGGLPHYHFVIYNGIKYPRIVFQRASAKLASDYEAKRSAIRKTLQVEAIANIRDADSEALEGIEKKEKIPKHVMIAEKVRAKLSENPNMSIQKMSVELATSRDTIRNAKKYLIDNGLL